MKHDLKIEPQELTESRQRTELNFLHWRKFDSVFLTKVQ